MEELKNLPGVDKLLCMSDVKALIDEHGKDLVTFSIRKTLSFIREQVKKGKKVPPNDEITRLIKENTLSIVNKNIIPVINASGIIIHTNLGRAPFGEALLEEAFDVLKYYTNLEYDLYNARRGNRNDHITELLKYITGAEDVLVVNNNAAAVMLILRTFAKNKEVIVSRGELIEIGGSFRIPEIMAASECIMREVGTTNKTGIQDFENAICKNTGLLFKAHKSNYVIKGFTQEASLSELVHLGKKHKIPVVFDQGTGLLRKVDDVSMKDEPDVKQSLATGVDLICFSGDKMLGGPQAGIIAGKKQMVQKLKKEPMMRALRVCKTTLVLLETACEYYLNDKLLFGKNVAFGMMSTPLKEIKKKAEQLNRKLKENGIDSEVVSSKGHYGGGALPELEIDSYSVELKTGKGSGKERSDMAEKFYHDLLINKEPVLGILRRGKIYFDVLAIPDELLEKTAKIIIDVYNNNQVLS